MTDVVTKEGLKQFKIVKIQSEELFAGMAEEWETLHSLAGTPVFLSFDWMQCWWKHFGRHENRRLHILLVKEDEELVAIIPLYEGRSVIFGKTIQRRLNLMGDGTAVNESLGHRDTYGRSDFLDFIVKPGFEDQVCSTLIDYFSQAEYTNFDHFRATHINDRSFIMNHLIPAMKKAEKKFMVEEIDICPSIAMTDDFEETFLYDVSSNTRRRLRQSLKAIGAEEGYEVHEINDEKELLREYEKMRDLHQERWNSLGYPGSFLDQRFDHFLKEYVFESFRKGNLSFRYATDSGGYCASRMAMIDNDRYYDYMSGFDVHSPSAKYRPGIGLLTLMIKEGHEEGFKSVELLRGDEGYKFDFTSEVFKNWQLIIPMNNSSKWSQNLFNKGLESISLLFGLIKKEITLLKVQKINHGLLPMIPNYLRTRIAQVKKSIKK
ncbi:GNAT family N-acetyltransferase [Balneola sp. MJW-20]